MNLIVKPYLSVVPQPGDFVTHKDGSLGQYPTPHNRHAASSSSLLCTYLELIFFLASFCPFSIIFLRLLGRDMAFSSDEQQIRGILAAELADNIKKGWEEVQ